MIQLKNSAQLELMKKAGRITGEALLAAGEMIREGVSTKDIDTRIRSYIESCGAKPSFLGYGGFPGSACISINDQVIHGIPSSKVVLQEGDIVKIDVGAMWKGYHGDSARTFAVGRVSEEALKLIKVTEECFHLGASNAVDGKRLGDIGSAIQNHAQKNGFSVVRDYVGHGIGDELHMEPEVPNFGVAGRGVRLYCGMVIAIEPMINVGTHRVHTLPDGWTVKTDDGRLSAHYEHTVAITPDGPVLLTYVG